MTNQKGDGGPARWWNALKALPPFVQAIVAVLTLILGGGAVVVINNSVSGSSSSASSPSFTGSQPGSPASSTPLTSGVVFYSGPVGVSGTGIDFDHSPPMPGSGNVRGTSLAIDTIDSGVIVTKYGGTSGNPSELQCREWAYSHAARGVSAAQGDLLCIITQQHRTVLLAVTNVVSSANGTEYDGNATVWNAP